MKSPAGGCRPIALSAARILITLSRFKTNAVTVARPIVVKPTIDNPSPDQIKFSFHLSCLGLNNGTSTPE